jgi:hypothetical protein
MQVVTNVLEERIFSILKDIYPEVGGDSFLRNVGNQRQVYTASEPRNPDRHFHRGENLKYQQDICL